MMCMCWWKAVYDAYAGGVTGFTVRRMDVGSGEWLLFNYKISSVKPFMKNPVLAYMRGHSIYVDRTGAVIPVDQPFTKFFNVFEWDEMLGKNRSTCVDAVYVKYDGTLIICSMFFGEVRCHTRGVFRNVFSEVFNDRFKPLIDKRVFDQYRTLLFELFVPGIPATDRRHHRYLQEGQGKAVLLAARTWDGELVKPDEVDLGRTTGIGVAERVDADSVDGLKRLFTGEFEGFVVWNKQRSIGYGEG